MRKLLGLLLATATPAAAQQTFQPGRLPATSRDSFDVVFQGQTVGAFIMALAKTGDNFTLVIDARLPSMGVQQLDSVVFHGTSLAPVLATTSQSMMGQTANTRISVASGKATGTAQRPGPGGVQTATVDVPVPAGIMAEGADAVLIPTLDLSQDLSHSYQTFDPKTGKTTSYKLDVLGKETVTVPAGTFETWKVQLTGNESTLAWITTAEPKKLVMMRLEAAQMEMRRSK